MKTLIQFTVLLCSISCAAAQDLLSELKAESVLRVYNGQDLMPQQSLPNCKIISMDGSPVLEIEKTNFVPIDISLLKITNSVARKIDSLSIDMKYTDASAQNTGVSQSPQEVFLDVNSWKGQRYSYFSPDSDPEGDFFGLLCYSPPDVPGSDNITDKIWMHIGGKSNWKRFSYVRIAKLNENPPGGIELVLHFRGPGRMYIRSIKIRGAIKNWFAPALLGTVGGIAGTLVGCCGALIGCLAGMGKARRFVLATTKCFIALGIILTIAGIFAAVSKQPWFVYYPLVLIGGILTFVFSVNLYPIKRSYDDLEIRRMTSMDASQ